MKSIRAILLVLLGLVATGSLNAQIIEDPTTWKISAKKTGGTEYKVIFDLTLKKGWHIWSLQPGEDVTLLPPEFKFKKNPDAVPSGKMTEAGHKVTGEMDGAEGIVSYYHDHVTYTQNVKVTGNTVIKGTYMYQVCDDKGCLPPKTLPFSVEITDAAAKAQTTEPQPVKTEDTIAAGNGAENIITDTLATAGTASTMAEAANAAGAGKTAAGDKENGTNKTEESEQEKSLLWLFLAALGGGLAAVITPCVYSMIPITVSFFTKRSKTRAEGIRNALYYSLSIILIFTVLGIAISAIFGANALNTLSTNWIANLFFFAIFVLFGISFLGAFELTLPSSWTNKTDSKAGVGSFGGIFFMALTLAIVSFSCTGPIVGPLLVLAGKGGLLGPAVGMFGFSVGLSLPFALFAIFPGMLNKMAQSGGWLNQVKVVLGFLELMLAMKFFSNADLAQGWRLLDREVFIAVWIVIAILLGIYLLGKLKLSHDDAPAKNIYGQEYVSIFKLFMAIISFSFAVYLLPGMWGAPLNGMSAFLPPMGTFDQFGNSGGGGGTAHNTAPAEGGPVKYVNDMKIYEPPVVKNLGLVTYFDYEEALEAGKKQHKPVMLDFTGINCVNCRKMESQVWSHPEVAKRLKEDFVVASLYCDFNRIELPEEEQYFSKGLGAMVITVGNKNAALQAEKFGSNSQPFYFYVDEQGNKLIAEGYSYDPDVQKFIAHLDKVKENYKASNKGE